MYRPSGCGDVAPTTTTTPVETVQAGQELNNDPSYWGQVIAYDSKGRPSHYRKDLGKGQAVLTFVIYARDGSPDEVGPGQSDAGHPHGGTVNDGGTDDDGGKNDGGKRDGAKQDGGRNDGGKKDGGRNDGGRNDGGKNDGGKRDGGKQRSGDRDRRNH